jgi:glutaredoxin-like protein NrdH
VSVTVTVYTSLSCTGCTMTKRHLDKRGVSFTEVRIDSDPLILEAIQELGFTSAPVVCANVDGVELSWAGYRPDRLDSLVREAS